MENKNDCANRNDTGKRNSDEGVWYKIRLSHQIRMNSLI